MDNHTPQPRDSCRSVLDVETQMRIETAILVLLLAAQPSVAQDTAHPAKLSGFLKPGMCLGVRAFDETNGIKLTIYSPEDFEIAVDARTLGIDELAEKHLSVKRQRDEQLREFAASLEARQEDLPPNVEFGEPRIGLSFDRRELLCKIEPVGDDYFLIRYGDDLKSGRVLATAFVTTIQWHAKGALNFSTSVGHVAKKADRTKP